MKNRFVRNLQPNEIITTYFLVQSKETRLRKTGEPYMALVLSDRTGQLDAKMWDGVEEVADTFDRDDFVKVKGVVQNYRNRPQMTIHRLRRLDESEVQLEDYLPRTTKDTDAMFAELRKAVEEMENLPLKQLLESFLADEEVASRLKVAPAAKSLHHAFIGGLLEHICSLLNLGRLAAQNYDFIDLDLLKAGILLHDLGKIHELTYQRAFGYSTEGHLLGHIVIVMRMIDRKCAEIPGFPPKLKTLLEHMILSHHGKYEFGSPKLPTFPEALMLHYIDDLDSKLESMRASVAADTQEDADFTRFNPSLERSLLKKDVFLERETSTSPREAAVKPASALSSEDSQSEPTRPLAASEGRPDDSLSLFGERLQSAWGGASGEPKAKSDD